jgi:hypothetical protein
VAVATINSVVTDMMLVTELNGLLAGDLSLSDVRRAINRSQKPKHDAQEKETAENAHLGDGIGAGVEYLGHAEMPLCEWVLFHYPVSEVRTAPQQTLKFAA